LIKFIPFIGIKFGISSYPIDISSIKHWLYSSHIDFKLLILYYFEKHRIFSTVNYGAITP